MHQILEESASPLANQPIVTHTKTGRANFKSASLFREVSPKYSLSLLASAVLNYGFRRLTIGNDSLGLKHFILVMVCSGTYALAKHYIAERLELWKFTPSPQVPSFER